MKPAPWLDEAVADNGLRVRDNFLAWFGKSKVVDAQKLPLQLFHGTTRDFGAFDPGLCRTNAQTGAEPRAVFLSTSPEVAASYAGQKTPDISSRLPTEALYEQWLGFLKRHGPGGLTRAFHEEHAVPTVTHYAPGGQVMPVYVQANRQSVWTNLLDQHRPHVYVAIREALQTAGFDGLSYLNKYEGEGSRHLPRAKNPANLTWVAFTPSQVKSALCNSGLFQRNNPSMIERHTGIADDVAAALARGQRARSVAQAVGRSVVRNRNRHPPFVCL